MAHYMTVVSGFVMTIVSFLSGILTNKFGRRQVMLIGQILMAVTLLSTGIVALVSEEEI